MDIQTSKSQGRIVPSEYSAGGQIIGGDERPEPPRDPKADYESEAETRKRFKTTADFERAQAFGLPGSPYRSASPKGLVFYRSRSKVNQWCEEIRALAASLR